MSNPEQNRELACGVAISAIQVSSIQKEEVTKFIRDVYKTLSTLDDEEGMAKSDPAVSIDKSITPDYIICLEDGKKLKMLKRYIRTQYGLSPQEYRRRWGLPDDYPMVAPNYAKKRSAFAKKIGLGRAAGTPKKTANKRSGN